jgi:hypothetical protein
MQESRSNSRRTRDNQWMRADSLSRTRAPCPFCDASSVEVIGRQGIGRTVSVMFCVNCESIYGELNQDADQNGDDDRPLNNKRHH